MFIAVWLVLPFLLLLLGLLFSGILSTEKVRPFECGFDSLTGSRSSFTTRYFLLVIIFLIFDVELSLIFPLVSLHSTTYFIEPIFPLVIVVIILIGIYHEKNEGAIEWIRYL